MKVTTDACLFGAWVSEVLSKNPKAPNRILDIGTGTGVLSLMLAQKLSTSSIDAVELDQKASEEASRNFSTSPWTNRLFAHNIAVQNFRSEGPFDVIITNPPFYDGSPGGKDQSKNIALHSWYLSQQELIEACSKHLHADGSLFILYPAREMEAFIKLALRSNLGVKRLISVFNQPESKVFRRMAQLTHSNAGKNPEQTTLTIRATDGKYSQTFWHLLSDYYLEYNNPELQSQKSR